MNALGFAVYISAIFLGCLAVVGGFLILAGSLQAISDITEVLR